MRESSNLRTTTTSFSNIDLVTCLGDRFREHLPSTRLPDSDLPVGRHFASSGHITQDMLVSVISSVFRDATYTLAVSMWTLVSSNVSPRCKRCDFCFYLSVTLHAHFSVAFKPLIKREYPRNVWLTITIFVRKFELSFTFHPFYCAAHSVSSNFCTELRATQGQRV